MTWQPIDTAPKDGTPVLCFTPDDHFSPVTGMDVLWFDGGHWLYNGDPWPWNPTHWMPLPEPPK
ncbi:DUF551 domain-containing protein [Paracoccus sp. SY]|uniref:DUF551 domain-containing protein n=1 Tax=Paracoccus sp. SY TaxID=1330255 RepID=UPI000CD104E4